mmetsp:Transcript_42991/g.98772  ORF Transcript_42991/g.98772 Transcript_42991/m.98772 type:complete len:522 (-) Transcript_42991:99-1664(-)
MASVPYARHGKLRAASCVGSIQHRSLVVTTGLKKQQKKLCRRRCSKLVRYRRARDSHRVALARRISQKATHSLQQSACKRARKEDAFQSIEEIYHDLHHKLDFIARNERPGAAADSASHGDGVKRAKSRVEPANTAYASLGATPSSPSRTPVERRKRTLLALTATSGTVPRMRTWIGSMPGAHTSEASCAGVAKPDRDGKCTTMEVVERILAAELPEDVLGINSGASDDAVSGAWKLLVLMLHPDKLSRLLDDAGRAAGAEALQRVHMAKDELRQRDQQKHCSVPVPPEQAQGPRCTSSVHRDRKYEIHWSVPPHQDPNRPVERYEVWGPRCFSDLDGEPADWVLLVSLSNRQSHFVLVEQAPTQQDVMWAADRVLRPTLPLAVHACNGAGSSEPCVFELPWATAFPWLRGTPSVVCQHCLRLNMRREPWVQCNGCGKAVGSENAVVMRCPECQGEVLWSGLGSLGCTSCLRPVAKEIGGRGAKGPKPPLGPPPGRGQSRPGTWQSNGRGGRSGGRSYGEW